MKLKLYWGTGAGEVLCGRLGSKDVAVGTYLDEDSQTLRILTRPRGACDFREQGPLAYGQGAFGRESMLAMRKEGGTRAQSVTRRNAKCNEHGSVTSPLRVEAYNLTGVSPGNAFA